MTLSSKPLIYNSDIREIGKKSSLSRDDVILIRFGQSCAETKIQTHFVKTVKALHQELSFSWRKNSDNDIVLAQRDNGASTEYQRMKKGKEGTLRGMPDFDIFLYNEKTKQSKVIFVEAKRIDSPSGVVGDEEHYEEQLKCQARLRKMGHSVYLTNNPVYFRDVICGEIRGFLNLK